MAMDKYKLTIRLVACAAGLVFFLSSMAGCALFRRSDQNKGEHVLIREGVEAYNKRDYKDAIEAFQTIKDRYPFSRYATLSELKIADAHFNLKEYAEAVYEYQDFLKLHPQNEAVAYVHYQIGMCYFKQMRKIDREQDFTRKATAEFQRLIKTYPDSPFRHKAENRLRTCLQNLADHEMYIGRFYFKNKNYQAAKARFEGVLKNFPDLGQYREALQYLKMCNERIHEIQEKQAKERKKENS